MEKIFVPLHEEISNLVLENDPGHKSFRTNVILILKEV